MLGIFQKIFSSANQRRINAYEKVVKKINAVEEDTRNLSEAEFKDITLSQDDEDHNLIKVFEKFLIVNVKMEFIICQIHVWFGILIIQFQINLFSKNYFKIILF